MDTFVKIFEKLAPNGPKSKRGIVLMPIFFMGIILWFCLTLLMFFPLIPLVIIAFPYTMYREFHNPVKGVPEHWSTKPFLLAHKFICEKILKEKQNNN